MAWRSTSYLLFNFLGCKNPFYHSLLHIQSGCHRKRVTVMGSRVYSTFLSALENSMPALNTKSVPHLIYALSSTLIHYFSIIFHVYLICPHCFTNSSCYEAWIETWCFAYKAQLHAPTLSFWIVFHVLHYYYTSKKKPTSSTIFWLLSP